jgi:hypothetical protein
METTFYFISFYYSDLRELLPIETRKMVCYSDDELSTLKYSCRKQCRQFFCNGFGLKPSDVTYCLSAVSERQYDESTYSLL